MAFVDYFLAIDGIAGESTDERHRGEIEVESFSFGLAQRASGAGPGGAGAGGAASKVAFQDFSFVMAPSAASPPLFLAVASGRRFSSAVFTCRRAGAVELEFLKYVFADLVFTAFS
jgi:type VI secretion system secreted protein Hcp